MASWGGFQNKIHSMTLACLQGIRSAWDDIQCNDAAWHGYIRPSIGFYATSLGHMKASTQTDNL